MSEAKAPVRIALVGTGVMGSLHARVIAQSPNAELVAVIEPRAEAGEAVANRYGARWLPSIDAIGDLADVDGVVIAAATEAHPMLARPILEAGIPLLVEKPVAAGIEDTRELLALSEKGATPMMCGLLERFNPAVLTAQAIAQNPVHVTATRHSPYVPRIRTGVTWDLLVHDVDLAVRFLGANPTRVAGSTGEFHPSSLPGADDVAEVVLTFDSGAIAQVSASRIGQRKVRSITIHDVDQLIELDLLRRDVTVYRHVSDQAADEDGRGYRHQTIIEIPELISHQEPLAAQLDHFVALIRGEVDQDAERASILPSHRIIDELHRAR